MNNSDNIISNTSDNPANGGFNAVGSQGAKKLDYHGNTRGRGFNYKSISISPDETGYRPALKKELEKLDIKGLEERRPLKDFEKEGISEEDYNAIKDAEKAGILVHDAKEYDRSRVFKQLEDLLNAYLYVDPRVLSDEYLPKIPREEIEKYDGDSGHPALAKYWTLPDDALDDTEFKRQWAETKRLMKKDPRARAIIYKALKDAPVFKRSFDYYKRHGMDFEEGSPIWNPEVEDEMNNNSYSFAWEDADLEANTKAAEEAIAELGPTEEDLAEIEAGDDNPEKLLADLDDDDNKESWGNITNALKDKRY